MDPAVQQPPIVKARYQLPLLVLTMVFGCIFIYAVLDIPTLEFHQLHPSVFSAPSFQIHSGFVGVLRWLESLHSREDLLVFRQLLTQAQLQARVSIDPVVKTQTNFATQVAAAYVTEMILQVSKLGLQFMLVLFLYRQRTLSKHRAVSTLCLCILSLLCWKIAQACVLGILAPFLHDSTDLTQSTRLKDSRDEVKASFLNVLFLARCCTMCFTSAIFGRAYQVYFCEPWPILWKRIPAYLGSKNLVISTIFFGAASVSAISATSTSLRSLSEAASHLELLALAIAFGHFVVLHLFADNDDSTIQSKEAND